MKLPTFRASFLSLLFFFLFDRISIRGADGQEIWRTRTHQPGYCALYGQCGENRGGILPCAHNRPAERVEQPLAEALAKYCPFLWNDIASRGLACCTVESITAAHEQILRAHPLLSGCPACWNNFANLFCTISCSPDQSMFADVVEVRSAASDASQPPVKKVEYAFANGFKNGLFDSCKEVKFPSTTASAITFFGDPKTADAFLQFFGHSVDEGGESPYALDFLVDKDIPSSMTPYNRTLPTCSTPGFECSCADCSQANYCKTYAKSKRQREDKFVFGLLRGYEIAILAAGSIVIGFVWWLIFRSGWERRMYDLVFNGNPSDDISVDPQDGGNEFRAMPMVVDSLPIIEQRLRDSFQQLGYFIAKRPHLTLFVSLFCVAVLSIGNINYQLESDPQGLWTPSDSRTVKDQKRYESSFGKFYRIENLILMTTDTTPSPITSANGFPSIVTYQNMELMFRIQETVNDIRGVIDNGTMSNQVALEDVCYKATDVCVIESVLQYWKMERRNWETLFEGRKRKAYDQVTRRGLKMCLAHWSTECRSAFEAPIDPKIVLGGFPTNASFRNYLADSTAFSVTYLLDNSAENEEAAKTWEKAFLDTANTIIKDMATNVDLQIAFRAERSTEDELRRETYMDAGTIIISYVVMFVYIAAALTFLTKRHVLQSKNLLVNSHVKIGLQGVAIVVFSVFGAFGVVSCLGMKVSMIVLEVLPFLLLAVGVDNMFILANELRSYVPMSPLSERLGDTMSKVGPSITCAALSEALAFGLAALAPIPAARSFSLCACFAVLIDFFLQCTAFTALLVLDTRRRETNRIDCLPCLTVQDRIDPGEIEYCIADTGTPPQEPLESVPGNDLQSAVSTRYIPFLLGDRRKAVRVVLLSFTVALFTLSCIWMGRMELGMEQQVAFPRDSYLQEYFTDGLPAMRVGAPVMFVVDDLNVSTASSDVDRVCAVSGCDPDSFVSQIDLAAAADAYHLASPAASWIDEFLVWIKSPSCCRTRRDTGEQCAYADEDPRCVPCLLHLETEDRIYQHYLPAFMQSRPNEICSRGGKGVYEDYIQHATNNSSRVLGLDRQIIQSSAFRSNYVPLVSQTDYIDALRETFDFVDALKRSLGLEIYAYSIFHVFFQQYLNLVPTAAIMIAVAVSAVFIVCWIVLSSLKTASIVMVCVVATVVDLIGVSYLLDVKLNGVSVVNITMSIGIAVEFCVHLAHAFLTLSGSGVARVGTAFEEVGVSVITGITVTKFLGVIVLSFAKTKLFQVYYFRMYMALVFISAWHGLVVLPVLLAMFGPITSMVQISSLTQSNNDAINSAEHHSPNHL